MTSEEFIDQFFEDLAFLAVEDWCWLLEIPYEEPVADDDYPDWEDEIRCKLADSMKDKMRGVKDDHRNKE